MFLAPFKAVGLAFLLLVPSSAPVRGTEDPPDEKVVIADEEVFAFEDDDEPLVLRHQIRDRSGFLGVRLLWMTPEMRAHFGAPREAGVLVSEVEPESPAAKAGIQVGDIITEAGGEKIDSPRDLAREVHGKKAGETLDVEISRGRSTKRLTVTIAKRKGGRMARGDFLDGDFGRRRFKIRDLDSVRPLLDRSEDLSRLRDRLEEMEKRVKELEKKLGAR
jgi:membrane-associated protease RseP (regulator of RpoE activity)